MEHTLDELLEIIEPLIAEGHCQIDAGKLDGEDFLVVDSWGTVGLITGLLNGFDGLIHRFGSFNGETLEEERAKLEKDKALVDPKHLGTLSRIERDIKAIDSNIAYREHLKVNNIEEPKDIKDYVEFGFSDEYSPCCCNNNGCQNIVRTSPDSYNWTAPFLTDEGYACDECVEAGKFDEELLESYRNEQKSIPDSFDLDRLGLVKINEESFENGWYGGQCDTPAPIIEGLNNHDIDVWFKVYPRQFDLSFDVFVQAENEERAKEILSGTDTTTDEDPADVLKRGLEAASEAMKDIQGEGIKYSKINADGTASVRLVSPEEFVKGIK